jgi:hypothetical protein
MRSAPKVTLSDVWSTVEKHFERVWRDIEQHFRISIPPDMRRYVGELYIDYGDSDRYDLNDDGDVLALQEAFRKFAFDALKRIAKHRPRRKPTVKSGRPTGRPPVREREREKNARLLAFGAERIVPFSRLLDGELKPGRIGLEGVPWEELHAE